MAYDDGEVRQQFSLWFHERIKLRSCTRADWAT